MMPLRFRQERATQAAAWLLKRRGGTMSYMKLLKLLYLADREALLKYGRPITFDRYVSMDKGPVLSQTYNLIVEEDDPESPSYWRRFISPPVGQWEVRLIADAPATELSPAQEKILDDIFDRFGKMTRWELVKLTHQLQEWHDPHGSSVTIDIDEILRAGGMNDSDREGVEEKLAAEEALAELDLLSPVRFAVAR
jgi:uncharacterized phage-associated protein